MGDLFQSVMYPIELLVAWIMYGFHQAFTTIGMPGRQRVDLGAVDHRSRDRHAGGDDPAVRQADQGLPQAADDPAGDAEDPEEVQGQDRPGLPSGDDAETMALYKKEGTNPSVRASADPRAVPFFGLFRVLNGLQNIADGKTDPIGPITKAVAARPSRPPCSGRQLSDKFIGADSLSTQIVTVILIVLMSATTFTTQRQLMMKNMPASALDNPFAKQQKVLLYAMPLLFAVSGINFPIGVLIYWFTTNIWSMVQQFYVIRRMPTPARRPRRPATSDSPSRARRSRGACGCHGR